MAIADVVAGMYKNLSDAYDAVEEMGGELPEQKNLVNLTAAVESIPASSGSGIFPPDLSKSLDQKQLDNLQNIVDAGQASEYLNLGDKLLVNYEEYVMPFEVVGFEDVEIAGGKKVPAINLLAYCTSNLGVSWNSEGSVAYSVSGLRNSITNTYQNGLETSFVACLASTKVQSYDQYGSTSTVYDKLFVPSASQLGITDTSYVSSGQAAVEGPAFTAYKDATNAKRVKKTVDPSLPNPYYWTRSAFLGRADNFLYIDASGAPNRYAYNYTCRMVAACNFIGKEGIPAVPTTLAELKQAINEGKEIAVGTEIPDTYDGQSTPLIVAQQLDSSNNSTYGGVEGVILVRKYVDSTPQAFGSTNYSTSTIKGYLDTTYLENCSVTLKSIISDIPIPYDNTKVNSKFFLMSGVEVGGTYNSGEGIFWNYWGQRTGSTSASNSNNPGRIAHDSTGAARAIWLRSNGSSTNYVCNVNTNGAVNNEGSSTSSRYVLPACFIGKD